tara:strand:+ start:1161 stop:1460 length:300 start_codon:yes stop_codon:yes gene_type:complete
MSKCNRCGNDTHEDELKFNFGVCDGCDQNKEKSNDRAFSAGWDLISKKSWDDLTEEEDSGWTENPLECRGCNHILSEEEWEQKRCPECGTRNTVHPSMR